MCTLSANQHVVLEVVGGLNGGCGPAKLDFMRVLPDGKATLVNSDIRCLCKILVSENKMLI
jgi:hypothetical protein